MRSALALICSIVSALTAASAARAGTLAGPYTDPAQFTQVPFGSHSHWLHPWRGYHETVPAAWLLNGVGMVVQIPTQTTRTDLIFQHLEKNGIKTIRTEMGWSSLDYATETLGSVRTDRFSTFLLSCQARGLRPVILLNGHHGAPCPLLRVSRTLPNGAAVGDRTVTLNSTSGLAVNFSGLNNLLGDGDKKSIGHIITAIDGNTVTLSQPINEALALGASVSIDTLKYRPFSEPGSADYAQTIAGWLKYVDHVATKAATILGTTNAADKGFDLEIWNELTFGSNFLYINRYYNPDLTSYNEDTIWSAITTDTANYVAARPAQFAGVRLSDGFGNTIPWRAAGNNADNIRSIGAHPYPPSSSFPLATPRANPINALGLAATFTPTINYTLPEYSATWVQTESALRKCAPLPNLISGVQNGRYGRLTSTRPMYGWFTETGTIPGSIAVGITDPSEALYYKTKWLLRNYCLFLNKGIELNCVYSWEWGFPEGGTDDTEGAWATRAFYDYVVSGATSYPADDTALTSLPLLANRRLTDRFKVGLDPTLDWTLMRPLDVVTISDPHDHFQFLGDGTAAHPTLYNRECLAVLPFQVNPRKFIVPYYVMTRDARADLPEESYSITLDGVRGTVATVSAYDPITDQAVPVTVSGATELGLTVTLAATDYPRLLIIEDSGNWPSRPTALVAQARTPTSVELTWTDLATNESGYQIERRLAPAGPWTTLATIAADTTRWTDIAATAATHYAYRVRATVLHGIVWVVAE
jgi:hypothetical protein